MDIDDELVEVRACGCKEVLVARGFPTWDTIQAQLRFANFLCAMISGRSETVAPPPTESQVACAHR